MNRSHSNRVLVFLAAFITLTACTWVIGLLDIQYKSETALAFNSGFPGDSKQWNLAGDSTKITLTSSSVKIDSVSEKYSYAMRRFALPPTEELLDRPIRVRGDIRTLKQASGIKTDDAAAYMIWFQDENGDTIQYTTVQNFSGDFHEYRAERIVSVPSTARSFTIVLINRDSEGAFELTDADVTLVKTTLLYQVISPAMFLLWMLLVLIAIAWLVIHGGFKIGIAVGFFLILTLVGILIPESVSTQYILPAYKKLANTLSLGHTEPLGVFYKVGHFLFFFSVSLTLILKRKKLQLSVWIILVLMLIFAVATEGLQLHFYNRSTRLFDIGIDLSGVALAVLIGRGFRVRDQKSIHTNDSQVE
ncbi:VanZ family protein [Granulosicoccus sp.]|nr:VanZ family protein [Granulosicoccus sp.]MDB4224441.1 VanZ family protein [Granulosicoccus sp.]